MPLIEIFKTPLFCVAELTLQQGIQFKLFRLDGIWCHVVASKIKCREVNSTPHHPTKSTTSSHFTVDQKVVFTSQYVFTKIYWRAEKSDSQVPVHQWYCFTKNNEKATGKHFTILTPPKNNYGNGLFAYERCPGSHDLIWPWGRWHIDR